MYADRTANGTFPIFFYAGDGGEPPTSTSSRDDRETELVDPVRLERSHGFSSKEIHRVQRVVDHMAAVIGELG